MKARERRGDERRKKSCLLRLQCALCEVQRRLSGETECDACRPGHLQRLHAAVDHTERWRVDGGLVGVRKRFSDEKRTQQSLCCWNWKYKIAGFNFSSTFLTATLSYSMNLYMYDVFLLKNYHFRWYKNLHESTLASIIIRKTKIYFYTGKTHACTPV